MKRILTLICMAFVINGIMVILTGSLLNNIMADCKLSYDQAGLLASIQSAGNLIAGAFSGLIIGRLGRKRSSVLYCLMFIVGFSVLLYSNNRLLIYICIFISGLGWGLCNNCCHLLVSAPGMKSSHMYYLHTSYAVGAFVGPMVLNLLLYLALGWRSSVWVVVISSAILMILFMTTDIPEEKKEAKASHTDLSFFKNSRYYMCFLLYFCYGGAETCINTWLVIFLFNNGICTEAFARTLLSVLWLVIIFGRLSQSFISKFIKSRYLLLAQALMMLICVSLLCVCKSAVPAVILIVLIGMFMAGITPANATNAGEFMHGDGLSSGLIFAGSGLGSTVLPYFAGVLFEKVSLSAGMAAVSALLLLMSVIALVNCFMLRGSDRR